eukprot:1553049-Heterocapsa_arctica.AAC.1
MKPEAVSMKMRPCSTLVERANDKGRQALMLSRHAGSYSSEFVESQSSTQANMSESTSWVCIAQATRQP